MNAPNINTKINHTINSSVLWRKAPILKSSIAGKAGILMIKCYIYSGCYFLVSISVYVYDTSTQAMRVVIYYY